MGSKSLKIGIVGYGRMGKEVEAVLASRGHTVAFRCDPGPGADITVLNKTVLSNIDGVIEFSLASGVVANAGFYAAAGIPAVVGTTGWEGSRNKVQEIVESSGIGYLYGSNFAVGAHLFFRLAAHAASMIRDIPEYDIMIHEFHHKNKADSPSGTALTTAEHVLRNLPRKTTVQTNSLDRPIRSEELHVTSTRGGSIPGIHTVLLDSLADSIEITHSARSRQGLATGSVLAFEWLLGKKGFINVEQFMSDLLGPVS